MTTAKINFKAGLHGDNKLVVNDTDLSNLASAISVDMQAGGIARMTIDVLLTSCDIDTEGVVEINGIPVNDKIGRQIFNQLKARYA